MAFLLNEYLVIWQPGSQLLTLVCVHLITKVKHILNNLHAKLFRFKLSISATIHVTWVEPVIQVLVCLSRTRLAKRIVQKVFIHVFFLNLGKITCRRDWSSSQKPWSNLSSGYFTVLGSEDLCSVKLVPSVSRKTRPWLLISSLDTLVFEVHLYFIWSGFIHFTSVWDMVTAHSINLLPLLCF